MRRCIATVVVLFIAFAAVMPRTALACDHERLSQKACCCPRTADPDLAERCTRNCCGHMTPAKAVHDPSRLTSPELVVGLRPAGGVVTVLPTIISAGVLYRRLPPHGAGPPFVPLRI